MPASALLVVQDPTLREVLCIALRLDGISVRTAADDQAAATALAAASPGVLILDGTMPRATLVATHAELALPAMPLILLTSAWRTDAVADRPGVRVLPMPFDYAAMRLALARCRAHPCSGG
jgi:DNA-binding NtrC family response regulator